MANRYTAFKNNLNEIDFIPFIDIGTRSSDRFETYILGQTTYDTLSNKYYARSDMGWLISLGNPEYINEYDIEDGVSIRIPFPLEVVEEEYNKKVEEFKKRNNI